MRSAFLGSVIIVFAAAASVSVSAQTDRKSPGGQGPVVAPKGTFVAPAKSGPKSNPTTAPRGTTMAPLTKGECEGLGGKVQSNFTCKSGNACYTVDRHGVIRTACINQ